MGFLVIIIFYCLSCFYSTQETLEPPAILEFVVDQVPRDSLAIQVFQVLKEPLERGEVKALLVRSDSWDPVVQVD